MLNYRIKVGGMELKTGTQQQKDTSVLAQVQILIST